MQTITALRKQYGITQQQLADYLSVSKGLVSMVEKGKRQFPIDTLLKLTLLQSPPTTRLTGTLAKKQSTVVQKQKAAAQKALQAAALDCKISMAAAERELVLVNDKYNQAINMLQLVAHLQQQSQFKSDKKIQLWVAITEDTALKQLELNGEKVQVMLQLKIESLQQKAALVKKMGSLAGGR